MTSVLSTTVGSVTLSNGNLTAKATGSGAWAASADEVLLGIPGLYYFEGVFSTVTDANTYTSIGISSPSAGYNVANWCALCSGNNGEVYQNGWTGVYVGSVPIVAGDNIGVALDTGNKLIWFRKNGGYWNNSSTAAPSTSPSSPGTGGLAVTSSAVTNFPVPSVGLSTTGDQVTINFGASSYAYTPPSGFSNWPALGLALVTQEVLETWYSENPSAYVTQEAFEVWMSTVAGVTNAAMLTQVALEVWASVANATGSKAGALIPGL